MALGKYRVPTKLNGVTGTGLQRQFAAWVKKMVGDARDAGFDNIELADENECKISFSDANTKAINGNDVYLKHAKYFCYGLAWEYSYRGGRDKGARWLDENKEKYGIDTKLIFDNDYNVKSRCFVPLDVEFSPDYSSVDYEGDSTGEGKINDSSVSGDRTTVSGGSVSSVAYFFSNQFNSIQISEESELLKGERALANDEPVYNTLKNVVAASMRSFSSTPSGKFVAWYPDYWGKANNTPIMTIKDIELRDLKITQSDSKFFSHVYCTGVNMDGTSLKKYQSQGVVSIESNLNALASEAELNENGTADVSDEVSYILQKILYIPEGDEWKYTPKELYRRYGARPKNADLTNIGSAKLIEMVGEEDSVNPTYIMPFLYALYSFMENWAEQNRVQVEITFNPSIIPGCRIRLESLDVSFYVKGVTHTMDYSSGFTTSITAVCPTGTLVSGMVNV